jgi:hypothetical protein
MDQALRDIAQGNDLRASCRDLAEQEFAMERQAKSYLELFGGMLHTGNVEALHV